jgi:hypothetical protein
VPTLEDAATLRHFHVPTEAPGAAAADADLLVGFDEGVPVEAAPVEFRVVVAGVVVVGEAAGCEAGPAGKVCSRGRA